jgi:membrane fusion protein (multidrug efflux system)
MPDGHQNSTLFEVPAKTPWRKTWRGRAIIGGAGLTLLVAASIWGVRYWTVGRFLESTNNAYLRADAVVIAPKVSGYVKAVLVGDNQPVVAGQPLLSIDDASYQAAKDLADAELAKAEADLVRFQADAARQAAARSEAVAQVAVAEAASQFATRDAARRVRLAAIGADAGRHGDEAISNRDQASGQLTAARAAVEVATRQLDALKAQIGQGAAAVKAAEARVHSAEADLAGTMIVAPSAGQVGDRTVRVGQYVQPGTRLMTVVPIEDLYLVANFKETQVGRMRPGQPVSIAVDALPSAMIAGTIDSLAPGTGTEFALLPPENATGNFTKIVQRVPVRIRLQPDPALRHLLRPGLSVEAEVDTRGPN